MKVKIMKRTGSAILALSILAGGAAAVVPLTAESSIEVRAASTEKDFKTEKDSKGNLIITEYTGSAKDIVVPAKIGGVPVVRVKSFGNDQHNKNFVTSVTISEGIKRIDDYLFHDFYYESSLKSIYIADSVTDFGDARYGGWDNTETSDTGQGLKCVWIESLETIRLPKGFKTINFECFYGCTSLKEVTIPDGVKKIDIYAFGHCKNLAKLVVPESVTNMEDAFISWTDPEIKSNCPKLVIYGVKNSYAQKYANKNNIPFKEIAAASSVNLSSTAMSLGKGETFKLNATVSPSNAVDKTVTWRTSDSKILTVDRNGSGKAVGTGTAWITARTVNGKEKSCKITVKKAPDKITLTKGVLTLGVGEKYTLGSSVNDGAASSQRTYRTSNSSIVKMTRTSWVGDFVAQKPGVAYVTVKSYNGKESTCKVTVKAAPTKVTLNKTSLTLKVGQSASLSANVGNSGCATRTFRTSNSSVVKMTKTNWTGEFKAVKKGVAYITVRTYNGKEASCKVTVV